MDTTGRHPAVQAVARWFTYGHLPPHLQAVSRPFAELAEELLAQLPDDPELSVALRSLLEAKGAAVRLAAVTRAPAPGGGGTQCS